MDRILKLLPVFATTFLSTVVPALRARSALPQRVICFSLAAVLMAVGVAPAAVQASSMPSAEVEAIVHQQSAFVSLPGGLGHPTAPVGFAVSAATPLRLVGQVIAPQVYTLTAPEASVVDEHTFFSHDHGGNRASRPSSIASRDDQGVPFRECIVPNEGGCDPTTNQQGEDDEGNTVSMTCELRDEVYIPLIGVGVGVPPIFSILPGFEVLGVRMCDYGPRCGAEWNWEFFEMYE